MVKVIIFHNRYRSSLPSGENLAVEADAQLLSERGHEVTLALRTSDDIVAGGLAAKIGAAFSTVHSVKSAREAEMLINEVRPDVVHFHNLYPLWSPAISRVAAAHSVPRVQVLHNYRLSCLSANHFREGEACFLCVGKRMAFPGLVHGCYSGIAQSLPPFVSRAVNNEVLLSAEHFLAVSETVRNRAIGHGVDENKISVKPDHIPDQNPPDSPLGDALLFASRLDVEKGLPLLLDAYLLYRESGGTLELRIAGAGPLDYMAIQAHERTPGVRYLGRLDAGAMATQLHEARAVIVPSIWEEPFGRTVLEAWMHGRPVVSTAQGGAGDLVREGGGWAVPADPTALAGALLAASQRAEAMRRGSVGRETFRRKYSGKGTVEAYERAWRALGVLRPLARPDELLG